MANENGEEYISAEMIEMTSVTFIPRHLCSAPPRRGRPERALKTSALP